MNDPRSVGDHYARYKPAESVLEAVDAIVTGDRPLTVEDLAPLDEFHIRGREATMQLADSIQLSRDDCVLDVGSGIGGPARFLATAFGCQVVGVDLTADYCRLATELAKRVGLDRLVRFEHGNALDLPFADALFDVVWLQHASMNINDKRKLIEQIYRVLRPGGHLALHEVMLGRNGPPRYPVPWADDESISFLQAPSAIRDIVAQTGFEIASWRDDSEASRVWFGKMIERIEREGLPQRSIHLLMGQNARQKIANVFDNLHANRITVIMAVLRRPRA